MPTRRDRDQDRLPDSPVASPRLDPAEDKDKEPFFDAYKEAQEERMRANSSANSIHLDVCNIQEQVYELLVHIDNLWDTCKGTAPNSKAQKLSVDSVSKTVDALLRMLEKQDHAIMNLEGSLKSFIASASRSIDTLSPLQKEQAVMRADIMQRVSDMEEELGCKIYKNKERKEQGTLRQGDGGDRKKDRHRSPRRTGHHHLAAAT